MLLVDSGVDESLVLDRLSSHGIRGTIAESTEPVLVSDWVRLETTTLSSALRRLIPGDPRRDAYLQRLGQWFGAEVEGRAYRVYYVPTRFPFGSNGKLSSALSGLGGRFVLPDSRPSSVDGWRWPAFALSALVLVLLWGPGPQRTAAALRGENGRGRLALRGAILSPWFLFAAFGPEAALVGLLWAAALIDLSDALLLPFLECRRSASLRSAMRSLAGGQRPRIALFLPAFGILALKPAFSLPVSWTLLAVAGATALAASWPRLAFGRRRRAFVPRPLGTAAKSPDRATAVAVLMAMALWGGFSLLAPERPSAQGRDIQAPMPVYSAGKLKPGPAEARQMIDATAAEVLPGLPEWLAHRALEQSLPLRVVGTPIDDPFASVAIPEPQGLARGTGPSLRFDDAWARQAYRSIPSDSLESMLIAQGHAVAARPLPLPDAPRRPLAPIEVILYIILLILPLRRIVGVIPPMRDSSTREVRQEA
ncbi:MAG TPA: hypothetical protein VMV90_09625 [Rectinemataceae bacterium]|nr:hypothetical protein [Rectinemataceae bacterium]